MIINFDYYNRFEKPNIILCNPNRKKLFSLQGICKNTKMTIRYNAISEISFTFPQRTKLGEKLEAYDYIVSKRLLYVENFGYFILENPEETSDGSTSFKNITGKSYEYALNYVKLTAFKGTLPFYDPINPSASLMGKIIALCPTWTLGTIDGSLYTKYRTFDISDTTVYQFLMGDCETAYECIFTFDTTNRTINALSRDTATTTSDIYLSFDNLIKDSTFKEYSDELCTCLSVYGAGDLDIRSVNPLGSAKIYNFDYFKNTNWMSQELIDAIDLWEELIINYYGTYSTILTDIKNKNVELYGNGTAANIGLYGQMDTLKSAYTVLETQQKLLIEAGHTSGEWQTHYDDILSQMASKQTEIDTLQVTITAAENYVLNNTAALQYLVNFLSLETNFSPALLSELNNFIFENTYQNENFIQTDLMTPAEIQTMAQDLYNQGKSVLDRVSYPRYEITANTINFPVLKEYAPFTKQLNLGSEIYINIDDKTNIAEKTDIKVVVLEIGINWDEPTDFTLTLSNRLRLDNGKYVFSDVFTQAVKTGTSGGFNGTAKWGDWSDNHKDDVTTFINSALDATKNALVNNATKQEIVIDTNGLRGRFADDQGNFDPHQVWLTSNILAFTKDNWNTVSTALGKINVNGVDTYGIVGETIVSRILASNTLTIENENADGVTVNFRLDATGAYLTNANFNLIGNQGKNQIVLDPTNGIKVMIQKQYFIPVDPSVSYPEDPLFPGWVDTLYVDTGGNLTFTGKLQGASGDFTGKITATEGIFGGFTLKSDGIYSPDDTHYLKADGDLKWGRLSISGDEARFDGDIWANHLHGTIDQTQDVSIPGDVVDYGSMSGDRVYGGTMSGDGGVAFDLSSSGNAIVKGGSAIYLFANSGVAGIMVNGINDIIELNAGETRVTRDLRVSGKIYPDPFSSSAGLTTTISVGGSLLIFTNGVLTGSVGGEL